MISAANTPSATTAGAPPRSNTDVADRPALPDVVRRHLDRPRVAERHERVDRAVGVPRADVVPVDDAELVGERQRSGRRRPCRSRRAGTPAARCARRCGSCPSPTARTAARPARRRRAHEPACRVPGGRPRGPGRDEAAPGVPVLRPVLDHRGERDVLAARGRPRWPAPSPASRRRTRGRGRPRASRRRRPRRPSRRCTRRWSRPAPRCAGVAHEQRDHLAAARVRRAPRDQLAHGLVVGLGHPLLAPEHVVQRVDLVERRRPRRTTPSGCGDRPGSSSAAPG